MKIKRYIKILLFILVLLGLSYVIYNVAKPNEVLDSETFKTEYESFNNKTNSSGKEYRSLNIDINNPIIYASAKDILDKIDNKETFVVYFGFPDCPWCRSVIETLLKVASDKGLEEIYYVDVKNIRDTIKLNEDGSFTKTSKGTSDYEKLLEKLYSVLDDYTLVDSTGNAVSTKEKRIYAPNVVAIKNGEAIEMKTGISDLQNDAYMELTDEMKANTYNDFSCIIKCAAVEETSCSINKRCE